jgi:type I restriction enzyme S subunit
VKSLVDQQLPEHWRVAKLSLVAKLGTGHTPSRSEPMYWAPPRTIPWLTTGDIEQFRDGGVTEISETKESISEIGLRNSAAVLHPEGTVALSRTASVGFAVIMGRDMATSQDFFTWTCSSELEPRFLLLCLRAAHQDLTQRLAMGSTHKTIYMPDIQQLRVPLPPIDEQRYIADVVAAEGGHVDRAIKSRAGLKDMLQERLEANIVVRVTPWISSWPRGAPAVDLNVSDAPASFSTTRLKWTVRNVIGGAWGAEPDGGATDIPCVRVADFDRRRRVVTDVPTTRRIEPRVRAPRELRPGDLLLEKSGGGERQVVGAVVRYTIDAPAVSSNFIVRLRPAAGYDSGYLCYLHRALYRLGRTAMYVKQTTGIQNLDVDRYLGERVAIPQWGDQERISDELDEATESTLEAQRLIDREIGLVRERREALITAAVTGQLDPSSSGEPAVAA